jgi:hypothetical protein
MSEYLPEVAGPSDPHRRNARIVAMLRAAATMIEIANTADDDLPEVMSVGVNLDEVTIQPWRPGAPVQAMRQFEALMTGTVDRKAFPLVLTGVEQVSILQSTGQVDGVQLTVSAATHRDTPVDGFLGVTEQTVDRIAQQEQRIDEPAGDEHLAALLEDRAGVIKELGAEVNGEQVQAENVTDG